MANLRKEARGRECQVRIYGVCNGNPETTVLAHYRMLVLTLSCFLKMQTRLIHNAWISRILCVKFKSPPAE